MPDSTVSVVIPLYRERASVDELISRCLRALESCHGAELVLVDDHSPDDTAELLRAWQGRDARVRPVFLPRNVGQFRATLAGIRMARGQLIVTLDGDLQDPPELIPSLLHRLRHEPLLDTVFACKQSRDDPWWLRAGAALYRCAQERLAPTCWPGAIGSYCAMRASVAYGILAQSQLEHANLAAVLLGHRVSHCVLPYQRARRLDGQSRVGFARLALEAVGSLRASRAI